MSFKQHSLLVIGAFAASLAMGDAASAACRKVYPSGSVGYINVRAQPSLDANVVDQLDNNDSMTYCGRSVDDNYHVSDNGLPTRWLRVTYAGGSGWVSQSVVSGF